MLFGKLVNSGDLMKGEEDHTATNDHKTPVEEPFGGASEEKGYADHCDC